MVIMSLYPFFFDYGVTAISTISLILLNSILKTGVKNWCQFKYININVKICTRWFVACFSTVNQQNSPNFFQVEATPDAFRKAINRV